MAVTLCAAPPAAGKTRWIVDQICAILKAEPLAAVWAIVPDRRQARALREGLARRGGALGANVVTFRDVYTEILERAGRAAPTASGAILHRLILAVVDEMAASGSLKYYAPVRHSPGFARTLCDRFGELQRARVAPDDFMRQAQGEGPPLAELARIYQAYLARLQKTGWADPEGLGGQAIRALEAQPGLLTGWRLVGVDGFDEFDPTQTALLQVLAAQVGEVLITLPGALDSTRPVHQRFQQAQQKLIAALQPQVVTLDTPPHLPPALAVLESGLLESGRERVPAGRSLHLLEAQSPLEEAREALRWIKSHVLRSRLALTDCAVFYPDPHAYRLPLEAAAHEFGLPVRFTQGSRLVETPAAAALLNLLQLPGLDYPRRQTLDCIRSPYFDLAACGLAPPDAAALEAACALAQVVGGKEQWLPALEALSRAVPVQVDEGDEELPAPQAPKGAQAARLALGLQSLMERLEPEGEKTARDWAAWLEDLLVELHFDERCEPEVLAHLGDLLRGLLVGEAVAGRRPTPYSDFLAQLHSLMQPSSFDPEPDPHQPAVLIGQLREAQGVRFQAVAILGLSEGVFPVVERADPLLDEAQRARFGLNPRLGRQQASLFYQAVTRADRFLLLTRPYLAKGGEPWEPSHYWSAVESLFSDCKSKIKPDSPRGLSQAASRSEALFWAVRQHKAPQSDTELIDRAQQAALGSGVLRERTGAGQASPYEGGASELVPQMGQLYPEDHTWSVSRLEVYAACPFRFFTEQVLKLEPKAPPELGFDASQLGRMLHDILEQAYRQYPDDLPALLDALPGLAAGVFRTAPASYGFRPGPLWEAQQEQLVARLRKSVQEMAEVNQGWTPVAFELSFGFERTGGMPGYPALELDTEAGRIRLHGFIDRVDRRAEGQYRVVDYKTGSSHLDKGDLLRGYRLQLPVYALAAQDACGVGEVVDGLYWSINQGKAHSPLGRFSCDQGQGLPGAASLVQAHIGRIVTGIRAALFPPQPPEGGCPSYCAAAAWCWHYEPGFG